MVSRGSLRQRGSLAGRITPYPFTNVYAGRVGFSTRLSRNGLTQAQATAAAQRMAAAGFLIAREDVGWTSIETGSKGHFVWTVPDLLMTAFATAGIDWLPLITTAPQWANGTSDFYVPATNDQNYADFCVAFLTRYGAGGAFWTAHPELPVRPVTSIELWNEPFYGDPALVQGFFHASGANAPTWPAGGPDPIKYASMCVAAGTAIRAAFPSVKIGIAGEAYIANPNPTSTAFLAAVLAAQPTLLSSNLFDAIILHNYPAAKAYGPWITAPQGAGTTQMIDPAGRFDRVRTSQQALGGVVKETWVTEVGWTTLPTTDGVSEAQQSEYLQGGYRRLFREWGVSRVYAFMYQDQGPAPVSETDYFNVLTQTAQGSPGTPKPAFTTLSRMALTGDDGVESSYSAAVLADTPLMYLRLGDHGGVARDHTKSGYHGSQIGTVTRKQPSLLTSDPAAYSTVFDGVSGGFTVPSYPALALQQALTVEAWVKVTGPTANSQILRKTGQYRMFAGSVTGGWIPSFTLTIGGVDKAAFPNVIEAIPLGAVTHVVSTYDGVNQSVYVNGRQVARTAQAGLVDAGTGNVIGVGYQGTAAGQFFPGSIQELAVYGYALSGRRIAEHYQAGVAALAVAG